eukprot:6531483-Karenia_brevis.AAC.1
MEWMRDAMDSMRASLSSAQTSPMRKASRGSNKENVPGDDTKVFTKAQSAAMVEGVGAALAAFSAVVDTRCQQSEEAIKRHEKELEDLKTEIVVLKGQLAQ